MPIRSAALSRIAPGALPQRANPHMHLLEAALAWIAIDDDPAWRRLADGIAALCLEKFIDPASGALREFFAADWSPAPGVEGRICEPGHHYEWAFLLDRWARLTSRKTPEAVPRVIAFADAHGLDARRGVVVNAVLADGSIHDPVARLWAQAERIRAYLAHRHSDRRTLRPPSMDCDAFSPHQLLASGSTNFRPTTSSSSSRRGQLASIISSARSRSSATSDAGP